MGNGKPIGFNLGAVWTDGTGMTENGFVINGRLTKLSENVLYEYNKKDLMKPWAISTEHTGRVNLVFTPVYHRVAKTDLVVLKSIVLSMRIRRGYPELAARRRVSRTGIVLDFLCHFSVLFTTRLRIAKGTENTRGLQALLCGCVWV